MKAALPSLASVIKCRVFPLTLAKGQRQSPLLILGLVEQITKKSFRHILFLLPHLGICLSLPRDFLHIKHCYFEQMY